MRRLLAVLGCTAALLSCSGAGTGAAGGVEVVAGFYPLAEAAERVLGGHGSVANLTPTGAEPHDLELSPDDVDAVVTADVVLLLGEDFQPAVEDAAARADGEVVDLLEGERLLEGGDPHVWLDPTRMVAIVDRTAAAIAAVDPDNRADYEENAAAFRRELESLDRQLERGLARCERDTIVTSHTAFAYLADRYGLTEEPVAGLSPESEPDPARLGELADAVRERGVTTVFYETLVSPRVARTLAREAAVDTAVLNPLEGLTDEQAEAGESYTSLMRDNLAALRGALDCR